MGTSTVTKGFGTILKANISSVYTTVPQVMNVTPPSIEMQDIETTHLTSTVVERCPTIIDPGTAKFDLEFDPSNAVHMQLWTWAQAGTVAEWKVILSDSGACEIYFKGFIKSFGIDQIDVKSIVKIPVTIQVTETLSITP